MRPTLAATFALVILAAPASAKGIDLSKPYGDTIGCINRNGQEVAADQMLLLTDTDLVTAASACTFLDRRDGPGGSLIVKAKCEAEGEEDQPETEFTISRSAKDPKKLVITDADGAVYGEVAKCR